VTNVLASHGGPAPGRTQKTSERIAFEIIRDVVLGGLVAGDKLPAEPEMAERYGTSRSSLREAIRILEVQGLIRLRPGPGGGTTLGSVDASNLARTSALYFQLSGATYAQLLDVQLILEPGCAAAAARHPDRAEPLAPFLTTADPTDEIAYRTETEHFHDVVYRLAANPVLSLYARAINHLLTTQVVSTMDPVVLRPAIQREHVQMAKALISGNADRAARLMRAHFDRQHEHYRTNHPSRLVEIVQWR